MIGDSPANETLSRFFIHPLRCLSLSLAHIFERTAQHIDRSQQNNHIHYQQCTKNACAFGSGSARSARPDNGPNAALSDRRAAMEFSFQKQNAFFNIASCYAGLQGGIISMNGSFCFIYFNLRPRLPQLFSV